MTIMTLAMNDDKDMDTLPKSGSQCRDVKRIIANRIPDSTGLSKDKQSTHVG